MIIIDARIIDDPGPARMPQWGNYFYATQPKHRVGQRNDSKPPLAKPRLLQR